MRGTVGEIVFAWSAEIDAWQSAREEGGHETETPSDAIGGPDQNSMPPHGVLFPMSDTAPTPAERGYGVWITLGLVALTIGAIAVAASYSRLGSAQGKDRGSSGVVAAGIERQAFRSEVDSWEVSGRDLVVFSEGQESWRRTFAFALDETAYAPSNQDRNRWVSITDLDGDRRNEVLFIAAGVVSAETKLYCFNSDSSLRFVYQPDRSVRYGGTTFEPPFSVSRMITTTEPSGAKSIWVSSLHRHFPSVVQRLTAHGATLGEYWTKGHVTLLKEALIGDRRTVLVGAIDNEYSGASLSALDYNDPWGTAPSTAAKFRCHDCPAKPPRSYTVFPRMELARVRGVHAMIDDVVVGPTGVVEVIVLQALVDVGRPPLLPAKVDYWLDASLRVVDVGLEDNYRAVHGSLRLLGRLDHDLLQRDQDELLPVLRWEGGDFIKTRPKPK